MFERLPHCDVYPNWSAEKRRQHEVNLLDQLLSVTPGCRYGIDVCVSW
jgi:hypothetical protein